jgi:large subunit ribosomal protein L4
MAELLNRLAGDSRSLILLADSNENVEKSTRNLREAKTLRANYLNVRDLLKYERILIPLDALDVIQSYLG